MNKRKLFLVSCVSLVTTSMVFAIRGDISKSMSSAFQITNEQMGLIMGAQIDRFGPGAALQYVGMLAVIFGAMYAYFSARGGYRAVKLPAGPETHPSSL